MVTYDGLLADWTATMQRVASEAGVAFPVSLVEAAPAINKFLSAQHRHHYHDGGEATGSVALAHRIYDLFAAHTAEGVPLDPAPLDAARNALDSVETAYAPLRAPTRYCIHVESPWHAEMLGRVAERTIASSGPTLRVLYVSDGPETMCRVYRVVHHVAALQAAGVDASWLPLTEAAKAKAEEVDVVVVFREPWNDSLERLHDICRARSIPIGFDIDDLLFDPQILTVENFDHLRLIPESERQDWLRKVVGYRRTLTESDFAIVSTQPLAEAAEVFGVPVYVLPNGLDAAMIAQADAALADQVDKPAAADGWLRLGYASGTATHQKDFAVVAPVLAALLDEQATLVLTVVGLLTLEEYPDLLRHRDRIEARPWVPHAELFREYARFDVNLAPLECGNSFCEVKSELKYFEAALAEVPTVASATRPYRAAIKDGETGYCALTSEEWRDHLLSLIIDAGQRARLGRNARVHAIAAFGPEAQSAAAVRTFQTILKQFRN